VVVNELLVTSIIDKVLVAGRERVVATTVLWHGLELVKRSAHLGLEVHQHLQRASKKVEFVSNETKKNGGTEMCVGWREKGGKVAKWPVGGWVRACVVAAS
jgi:hypothetical protein